MPQHFHQSVLKSQFVALVLCQRKLVEILQKQTQLEKAYVTAKNKISNHSSNRRGSILKKQQKDHGFTRSSTPGSLKPGGTPSCCQCRERSGSCRSMKQVSELLLFQRIRNAPTHLVLQNEKVRCISGGASQIGPLPN